MKISVGLPCYDSKLDYRLVALLLAETNLACATGDFINVRFLPGCTNLALGRNQLVKEFLNSDDDRLVFLDADVTFEPGSLLKIAHYKEDIVGGAYRRKTQEENYPIGWLPGDLISNASGLLEVGMLPTGFLSISRDLFSRFKDKFPDRAFQMDGKENFCFFEIPYKQGHLYTEDAYFCQMLRHIGEKMWMDPYLTLTHWDGNIPYKGNIGQWLKARMKAVA